MRCPRRTWTNWTRTITATSSGISTDTPAAESAMKIQLTFLGATQNVTGSRYLLEAHGQRVLIDCGLYQERALRDRNWHNFGFAPDSLDAVLQTHAHLDHCGLLPRLVKEGF